MDRGANHWLAAKLSPALRSLGEIDLAVSGLRSFDLCHSLNQRGLGIASKTYPANALC
jgi:hypothetical protein